MIRMTVTQEIEATPEQIQEALQTWATRENVDAFPFEPGAYCRLTPALAEALGTHPDAPVMVLGRADGCAIGTVAFVSKNGNIQPMAVQPGQVRGMEDEVEQENPDA